MRTRTISFSGEPGKLQQNHLSSLTNEISHLWQPWLASLGNRFWWLGARWTRLGRAARRRFRGRLETGARPRLQFHRYRPGLRRWPQRKGHRAIPQGEQSRTYLCGDENPGEKSRRLAAVTLRPRRNTVSGEIFARVR